MLTVWYESKRNLMALYGALINTEYQEWERELSTEFKSGHILEYVWDMLGFKKKKKKPEFTFEENVFRD